MKNCSSDSSAYPGLKEGGREVRFDELEKGAVLLANQIAVIFAFSTETTSR